VPKIRRRTRRTDSNGALKEVYREPWDREQIENARKAGIPAKMLDAAGSDDWRDTGDITGLWSELVYVLDDCLRGVDHLGNPRRDNLGIVEEVFSLMQRLAAGLGIDPNDVIPWDVWYWRRDFSPGAADTRKAGEAESAKDSLRVLTEDYDGFGGPGPEHDNHGHGLANGTWKCLKEAE
jgi:hypothetical protein